MKIDAAGITRLAKAAGMAGVLTNVVCTRLELECFAALVAAAQRESDAKFCEENQVIASFLDNPKFQTFNKDFGGIHEGMLYAAAIRANKD